MECFLYLLKHLYNAQYNSEADQNKIMQFVKLDARKYSVSTVACLYSYEALILSLAVKVRISQKRYGSTLIVFLTNVTFRVSLSYYADMLHNDNITFNG